ncbi:MAG: peptide ABC transporter substrate-binding protein [Candidatus Gracilibacteria bacterium]|jgi:peptide/nickel transport system substrate-binding protein
MELFLRTLKSFSRREKWVLLVSVPVLVLCLTTLLVRGIFSLGGNKVQIYSEGLVGELTRLNPIFTSYSQADADISSLIFSGLVKYNAVTGTFEEDLATHTLSEDHLTYTFTLKNNLFWHDGTEVTADDVYYTFAEVMQSGDFENNFLKANFMGVTIAEPNSRTITFTLESPNSFFFTALTVGILPKHILADTPVSELDSSDFNLAPIGTGPYKVDGPYTVDGNGTATVTLTAFDGFYGAKPNIKNLRFTVFQNFELLTGNRSMWHGTAELTQNSLDQMDLSGLVTFKYELPQYTALFFNTDSPYLSKNKVRLGLSKAIDKEALLAAIKYKVAIDTPLLELDQKDWIHTFNLSEASGALYDSGWLLPEGTVPGTGTRQNADGKALSLRLIRRDFSDTSDIQEEIARLSAEMIKSDLAAVGVEVTIESYQSAILSDKIAKRDYDLLLYGQSLGNNLDTFAFFHSSQVGETGYNLSNYQSPVADTDIMKIRATFDESERTSLLNHLAETIAEDVPAVFLYTPSYYYAVDTKITGISYQKLLLPEDRFSNIAEWEIN